MKYTNALAFKMWIYALSMGMCVVVSVTRLLEGGGGNCALHCDEGSCSWSSSFVLVITLFFYYSRDPVCMFHRSEFHVDLKKLHVVVIYCK